MSETERLSTVENDIQEIKEAIAKLQLAASEKAQQSSEEHFATPEAFSPTGLANKNQEGCIDPGEIGAEAQAEYRAIADSVKTYRLPAEFQWAFGKLGVTGANSKELTAVDDFAKYTKTILRLCFKHQEDRDPQEDFNDQIFTATCALQFALKEKKEEIFASKVFDTKTATLYKGLSRGNLFSSARQRSFLQTAAELSSRFEPSQRGRDYGENSYGYSRGYRGYANRFRYQIRGGSFRGRNFSRGRQFPDFSSQETDEH